MKRILLIIVLLLPVLLVRAEDSTVKLETPKAKMSYALGVMVGRSIKGEFSGLDFKVLMAAISDVYFEKDLKMDATQVQKNFSLLRQETKQKKEKQRLAELEKNTKEGQDFLAKNKSKKGVHVLENGIQYIILKKGNGVSPTRDSEVTVHYRGSLINGTEFDSSYKRNQPATFKLSQVIKGWTETLPLMKIGSKWKIFIPSELAYGSRGGGQMIPPNATLIFEVELLEVSEAK